MGLRYPSARWTRQPEERGVLCDCRVQLVIVPHAALRLLPGLDEAMPKRHPAPGPFTCPGARSASPAAQLPQPRMTAAAPHGAAEPEPTSCVRLPRAVVVPARRPSRRAHDLRDTEGLAAAAADDGGLGEYGRDDPDVAAAVADGLHADTAAGGAVAGGRAPEAAGRVRGGRRSVGLEGALQSVDGRAVATLGLGVERDQRETAAGVRFIRVVEAQLLGDREESAVVVPAAREVSRTPRAAAMPWTAS